MTKNEYKLQLEKLEKEFQAKKIILIKEFALSNNPYKIGDKISDQCSTIEITEIKTYISINEPQCVYMGKNLNKNGSVNKKIPIISIYQSNIKK